MDDSRRRQFHSCDPCRTGKRRCDAPSNRNDGTFAACSNCRRWKKECTFTWLSSKPAKRVESRESRARAKNSTAGSSRSVPSTGSSSGVVDGEWYLAHPGDMFAPPSFVPSLHPELPVIHGIDPRIAWNTPTPADWQTALPQAQPFESQPAFRDPLPTFDQRIQGTSNPSSLFEFTPPLSEPEPDQNSKPESGPQWEFCLASDNAASKYVRSSMTHNLIRIYHDSMENALSCWLTEHNCPYTDPLSTLLPFTERKEWGPSWSNRMCIRVCRLDRVASSIRGRALSAEEEKTAARALHLAIIAFASQWTQHAQKGPNLSVPAPIADDERSIRKSVWNDARHALEHSTGIPSFRIIFANIIFSLTQSPLDDGQDKRLAELLDNDRAPIFLETANRQLYTFRHKFTRLQRETPPPSRVRELRRGSIGSTTTEVLEMPTPPSESAQIDPLLSSQEHRGTLGLLFWLGIMFDTLSSAMYQRPLVVSDEDSQIASASPPALTDPEDQVDLDCFDIATQTGPRTPRKQDVWGDFFLRHRGPDPGQPHYDHSPVQTQIRWPCSYPAAAAILSEATPVKVLLYRRVTQLQTLLYRGASPTRLEDAIHRTLLVYHHWNRTYQGFMLDCVANHESLPPRIQSWYVILDGHWHLAAMLLADVVESIDNARLGLNLRRQARHASNFVAQLRVENALAVGALARSSLHGQDPVMLRYFHDSLNEVAFLVEPWTVVLIHSFAKAGYISVDALDMDNTDAHTHTHNAATIDPPILEDRSGLSERLRQNCQFCICALQYLARKSDMAFLVARNLERALDEKGGQSQVGV
ncbi:Zn(II)2Cys6 transcription factor domain-containing protein [Aspergillus lucknowensis]|uniref:Zn(2)-C6 fungal-type domain-containing protein n=1 Tax=Aspergillus lucknowensis TaxID=176173 RepID=A0ABR4M0E3_9EURO